MRDRHEIFALIETLQVGQLVWYLDPLGFPFGAGEGRIVTKPENDGDPCCFIQPVYRSSLHEKMPTPCSVGVKWVPVDLIYFNEVDASSQGSKMYDEHEAKQKQGGN